MLILTAACIIYLVEVIYIVCKKGRVSRMGLGVPFALVPFGFVQFITNKGGGGGGAIKFTII